MSSTLWLGSIKPDTWYIITQMVLHPHNKSQCQTEGFQFIEQTPLHSLWSSQSLLSLLQCLIFSLEMIASPPCTQFLLLSYQHKEAGGKGRQRQWAKKSVTGLILLGKSVFFYYHHCFLFCSSIPWGPVLHWGHFSSTFYRWGNWGPPSWRQNWNRTRFPHHWINIHSTKSFLFKSNGSNVTY